MWWENLLQYVQVIPKSEAYRESGLDRMKVLAMSSVHPYLTVSLTGRVLNVVEGRLVVGAQFSLPLL